MLKELIISECNTTHLIKNAKQTIEWRRNKILELSSEGRNRSDIARILQVSLATINTDIQYLKQEAKANILEKIAFLNTDIIPYLRIRHGKSQHSRYF